ncbi:hypothetical protein AT6N2_C1661 [Agrobacterium tumefaciens]|nr:hypothetical protein AT6N2_C1661 [Agrobacterium tumefaciens]
MFERANGGQCRNCIEKQASCKIGQTLPGDVLQTRHHLLIGNGATIQHHLPGDLAGAGGGAFLSHQQLCPDLCAGTVDFFLMDNLGRLAQFIDDDRHQLRQIVAAGRGMHAEDACIGKAPMEGIDRVAQAPGLAHFLKQARRHAATENIGEDLRTVEIAGVVGLALETEQDLRIHEVAGLADFPAGIDRLFHHGRCRRHQRQRRKALLDLLHEAFMIDSACRDDEDAVRRIVAREIVPDLAARERLHGIGRAEDRAADRLVAIGDAGEIVEDHVVRRVGRSADFLEDDVFLALQFVFVEQRFRQDIGKDIDGERHMVLEDAGIIRCGFRRCRGVDFTTDIFDLFSDLPGRAARGALEGHMFEKMGDAVLGIRLVAGAGFDPHPKSDAFEMWHSFRDNGQPGRQPGQIYSHTQRLSAFLFAGACMFADEAFHGFKLRLQNVETLLPVHDVS